MVFTLRQQVAIYVFISICGISCEPSTWGFLIDMAKQHTNFTTYEFNTQLEFLQYPLKEIDRQSCDLALDLKAKLDDLTTKFEECLKQTQDTIMKDQPISSVFALISGEAEYFDALKTEDKDQLLLIVSKFEEILTKKGFGHPPGGYYQPLAIYARVRYLALAAGYEELEKKISITHTIDLSHEKLYILHPAEDKQDLLPMFKSWGFTYFGVKFDVKIAQFECHSFKQMENKYYLHLAKIANNQINGKPIDSPCHQARVEEIEFQLLNNECTKDFFDDKTPSKLSFIGVHDFDKCYAIMEEVFCAHPQKEFECPFGQNAVNKFVIPGKDRKYNFGGVYQVLFEKYKPTEIEALIKTIETTCLPAVASNVSPDNTNTMNCFEEIYAAFIYRRLIPDEATKEIIAVHKTWRTGKMLDYSTEVRCLVEKAKKKRIVTIAAAVSVFAVIIIAVGAAIVYYTVFRRQ